MDEGEMRTQRHFRLYMIDEASGLLLWDTEEEWVSYDRRDAYLHEGDEAYAADVADSMWLIEWAPEDEELRLMGAPTLPGF